APRRPMTQLPKRYRVTKKNPYPPLLHFAFPNIIDDALYKYAENVLRIHYNYCDPIPPSPTTLFAAAEHLSAYIEYELDVAFPFRITSDCSSILVLYKSVRPKWYFDLDDPWEPGEDEDDEDTN
ncbi:hypothetical protein EV363DRAFT_1150888, partial [Boletus edulis]